MFSRQIPTDSRQPVPCIRRSPRLRHLVGALLIIFLIAALATPQAGSCAEPVFSIECPERAEPGQPFTCRVISRVDFERVTVTWLDRTVRLNMTPNKGRHQADILLGTDVKTFSQESAEVTICGYKDGMSVTSGHRLHFTEASFPTQRLSLPPDKVSLSEQALSRHRKEKATVSRALSLYSAQSRWSLPLKRPVPGEISTVYGVKRILNGKPRSPHRGVDFRTGLGDPVRSCADGVVALTGNHFFAGNSVYVHHGQGMVSMYFHLSEISVQEGQTIERGQPVGLSGQTGRVTGPHLHFGLSLLGNLVDPLPLISPSGG